MNTEERARLETLIAHLDTLPPEKFNLLVVIDHPPECGTVACAIGCTPVLFPDLIEEYGYSHPGVMRTFSHDVRVKAYPKVYGYEEVAEWLFGIPEEIAGNLFQPGTQHLVSEFLEDVKDDATPQETAAMLRRFLKLVDQGDIDLDPDYDPTPYCSTCGARERKHCQCGLIASND